MFGNTKKTAGMTVNSEIETIIGKNTQIKGEIQGSGNIRLDGSLEGDIAISGDVIVGEFGKVTGNVKADNMLISGMVTGNVNISNKLEIFKSGQLIGDVKAAILSIDEGAKFKGHSDMEAKRKDADVVNLAQSKKA